MYDGISSSLLVPVDNAEVDEHSVQDSNDDVEISLEMANNNHDTMLQQEERGSLPNNQCCS